MAELEGGSLGPLYRLPDFLNSDLPKSKRPPRRVAKALVLNGFPIRAKLGTLGE